MRDDSTHIGLGATLAGICFAVVIAWALVSVLELTGTLTSATQIKHRVKIINAHLTPIHSNLNFVRYAGQVAHRTVQINHDAAPLTGQLAVILKRAKSIDTRVGPILKNATSINGVVKQINQNARSINAEVTAIGASVSTIGGSVRSISGSVSSITASVGQINSRVTKINNLVGTPAGGAGSAITPSLVHVDGDFAGILSDVKTIQPNLATVSGKVNTIIGVAAGIKSDFDGILANVGLSNGTPTVVGHANSIDCSDLIDILGKTTDCNMSNKT